MPSNFDGRLVRLERYAPEVNKGQAQSPAPMLMAFVADNGGRIGNESWAQATARLLAMPYNRSEELSPRQIVRGVTVMVQRALETKPVTIVKPSSANDNSREARVRAICAEYEIFHTPATKRGYRQGNAFEDRCHASRHV